MVSSDPLELISHELENPHLVGNEHVGVLASLPSGSRKGLKLPKRQQVLSVRCGWEMGCLGSPGLCGGTMGYEVAFLNMAPKRHHPGHVGLSEP